ncbi:ABC transporter ATP-binding protein [Priestia endophytica]|jgi:ABC-2 type transport system ATP-binding protein|uniref:ABC transporter ATP-binding protein n=1 Tax=Priestia endophytica TaxID=135735 RepID=UPI000F534E29|nr:ABC transporter ATP-binding protein [Priestia endophytica]RPK12891.1 hypothetical protein FH5_03097 [Priestia endophytica]
MENTETEKIIVIKDVYKKYKGRMALKGVSLSIRKGEIFGLLGPNGAGKSTLLSLLATIVPPSKGVITVQGLDLRKHKKKVREQIGYVPQDLALWEEFTVKDNLKFWSKLSKRRKSKEELYKLCEKIGLGDRWNDRVENLSGGMKRKLNICIALIHEPSILIMDEPTVGIDIQSKFEINRYVKELAAEGTTIIYTTHDMSEITTICHRMGVLKEGRMDFIGTIEEAKHNAENEGWNIKNQEELIYHILK